MSPVSKIIAVHQPNYLPWLGYFHKIASSDVFVLLDSVQYPRGRSIANRNKIKTAQGARWLTVPISIPKGNAGKISYLEIAPPDDHWKQNHIKTLKVDYGRAKYFQPYFDDIADILLIAQPFVEMNIALIQYFMKQFCIETPLYRLSELEEISGRKSQLIANICAHFDVDVYLSGKGAQAYNDEAIFAQQGVRIVYQQFSSPIYPQLHGEFIPNLSAVDLLLNCGAESAAILGNV